MEVDAFSIAALALLFVSFVAARVARRRAARRLEDARARARLRRRAVPVVSANVRGLSASDKDLWAEEREATARQRRAT